MSQADAVNASRLNAYAITLDATSRVSRLNAYAIVGPPKQYTITADAGAMALTGVAAGYTYFKAIRAASASIAATSPTIALLKTSILSVVSGDYALTGMDARIDKVKSMPVDTGVFTLDGVGVTLTYKFIYRATADVGSFALSGSDANLAPVSLKSYGGSIALAGGVANLRFLNAPRTLTVGAGSFALTGMDAVPQVTHSLDPYRSYVVLLMHMEDLTDQCGHTFIPVGNATFSTTQKVFGNKAGLLDGNGDYFNSQHNADWDFGTGPFVVEGWFYFRSTPYNQTLFLHRPGAWSLDFDTGVLYFRHGGGTLNLTYAPSINTWHAFCAERDADNNLRIYVDGVMIAKKTGVTDDLTSPVSLTIGSYTPGGYAGYDLDGYVDEVRITKGVARYASDAGYTLATEPFSLGVLSVGGGNFSSSGEAISMSRTGPLIAARTGLLHITGRSATLDKSNAFTGYFTLTGNANLIKRVPTRLSAGRGDFTISGSANLNRLKGFFAEGRSFYCNTASASLRWGHYLPLAGGEVVCAAQAVGYHLKRRLTASKGSFAAGGTAAATLVSRLLPVTAGSIILGGEPVHPLAYRTLPVLTGGFALDGQPTGGLATHRFPVRAGTVALHGEPVRFMIARRLDAHGRPYFVDAGETRVFPVYRLHSEGTTFDWNGVSALKGIVRTAKTAHYRANFSDANLWAGWGGDAYAEITSGLAAGAVVADGSVADSITATVVDGGINEL